MDQTTAQDLVDRAFREVRTNDPSLSQDNVHERSIVHKFAGYLQQKLSEQLDYDDVVVDCEYNRENHGDTKTLPPPEEDNEEDQIYPDVIVHKRGCHEDNLLVIEVKKDANTDNCKSDKDRLCIFTNNENRYGYDIGLFLLIHVGDDWEAEPEMDWYPK